MVFILKNLYKNYIYIQTPKINARERGRKTRDGYEKSKWTKKKVYVVRGENKMRRRREMLTTNKTHSAFLCQRDSRRKAQQQLQSAVQIKI